MVDKADCILVMYGGSSVPPAFRLKIFGLCQELPGNASGPDKKYYKKFEHFRKTIHGVLFVKFAKETGQIDDLFIDRELECFLVENNNIVREEESGSITRILENFLNKWS